MGNGVEERQQRVPINDGKGVSRQALVAVEYNMATAKYG
jgi:hypothetical protein